MALSNILRVFRAFVNPTRGSSAGTISEMPPSYAPKYPFNDAKATASGHLIEYDDTPGAERIQITHRTGTHIEMRPDGATKYKSVKNRQDVTIGDHEMIIQGDFNITVDGGSKIYIRNGSLEIQSDYGTAVNVKGELKVSADNIRMQAKKKISLVAPFVDIGGGNGTPPYITLPFGVVPLFGVPVPVVTGMRVPKIAAIPVPSAGANPAAGVASLVSSATVVVGLLNTIASYANNISKMKTLVSSMTDSSGDPLVPQIDQPEELPLLNPVLYSGINIDKVRLRDRQFDSPDDVEDSETYTAHLNVSEELKDFTPIQKELPGQLLLSDTTAPAPEPIPAKAFVITGTVTCSTGNTVIVGTGTKFTEELQIDQTLKIRGQDVKIAGIQNNTSLVATEPWELPTTNATPYVHILRPFSEFMDKYTYTPATLLGSSTLRLQDVMVNYIPPTIEKDNTGLVVPSSPSFPANTISTGPRTSYNSSVPEDVTESGV